MYYLFEIYNPDSGISYVDDDNSYELPVIGFYKTIELCIKASKIYYRRTVSKKFTTDIEYATISSIAFYDDNKKFTRMYGISKVKKEEYRIIDLSQNKVKL